MYKRQPDADHHLWQSGWDGWKDWREVDPISALVDALLADAKVPETLGDYVVLGPVDGHDDLLLVLQSDAPDSHKAFVHVALGGTRARVCTTARRFGRDQRARGPGPDVLQRELQHSKLTSVDRCEHRRLEAGRRRRGVAAGRALWRRRVAVPASERPDRGLDRARHRDAQALAAAEGPEAAGAEQLDDQPPHLAVRVERERAAALICACVLDGGEL